MRLASLFSGIGGLDVPFVERGGTIELMSELWEPAVAVLKHHLPDAPIERDIRDLKSLPERLDLVTAGFPCTDLSQAGRTAGISGTQSGLVREVFRLLAGSRVECVVLENVRNMLVLDGGRAMAHLTEAFEELGYRWAYRLVDSRFTGVAQRRHRVVFVACRRVDPGSILFADDVAEPSVAAHSDLPCGFYWTEGLKGLGWAVDSVPPLKGGSTIGIPSPPAIWYPNAPPGRRIVTPSIEDAEELQGFPRGWTRAATDGKRNAARWKLVGNAVTLGVGRWIADRVLQPGAMSCDERAFGTAGRWPDAAQGQRGERSQVVASHWPRASTARGLRDTVLPEKSSPLSLRAAAGFLSRADRSSLSFDPRFLASVREHVAFCLKANGARAGLATLRQTA